MLLQRKLIFAIIIARGDFMDGKLHNEGDIYKIIELDGKTFTVPTMTKAAKTM